MTESLPNTKLVYPTMEAARILARDGLSNAPIARSGVHCLGLLISEADGETAFVGLEKDGIGLLETDELLALSGFFLGAAEAMLAKVKP